MGKPSTFYKFVENPNICPYETLIRYLEMTLPLRAKQAGPLFLSFVKPHKPVTKQSLARWVKSFLVMSGFMGFTAHSTRGAAASKAKERGVSLEDILTKGNWSNKTTFEIFYNKTIVSPVQRFQASILS